METEQNVESEQEQTDETQLTGEEPQSTEEEQLTDEETQLVTEAIAASEEEEQVPAAVVGGLRRRTRAAELEAAELRGQLTATTTAPAAEKSPLVLAAEEQGVPVDEVIIDGALYQKQEAFKEKQTVAKSEKTATAERAAVGRESQKQAEIEYSTEKMGEGLDFETIVAMGGKYLTEGDKLDIVNGGDKCAQTLYKRCRRGIAASGGADAKTVAQKLAVHKKAQAELKNKQPGKPDGGKPPKVPSQDDILSAHTNDIFGEDW